VIKVHAKSDLPERDAVPEGSLAVSSVTGAGITELLGRVEALARTSLPAEDAIALNRRQATHLGDAAKALTEAGAAKELVLLAENLRHARSAFDQLTGRAGVEDVLDALFSRFCLGK
jgi:tRNA modification GTPase